MTPIALVAAIANTAAVVVTEYGDALLAVAPSVVALVALASFDEPALAAGAASSLAAPSLSFSSSFFASPSGAPASPFASSFAAPSAAAATPRYT